VTVKHLRQDSLSITITNTRLLYVPVPVRFPNSIQCGPVPFFSKRHLSVFYVQFCSSLCTVLCIFIDLFGLWSPTLTCSDAETERMRVACASLPLSCCRTPRCVLSFTGVKLHTLSNTHSPTLTPTPTLLHTIVLRFGCCFYFSVILCCLWVNWMPTVSRACSTHPAIIPKPFSTVNRERARKRAKEIAFYN